ncbi:MAG: hypothetical protein QOH06_736 [Acidobacteriota bacterium]|jgi:hypothetical protein|nr:hypothetical protein [Acidobacteriota bacterium]
MDVEIEAERLPRRAGAKPQPLDLIEQQLRVTVMDRDNGELGQAFPPTLR